jgi:hypothetical protein
MGHEVLIFFFFVDPSFQSDYLRKISLKLLTMETKSQNPIVNSLPSNATGSGNEHPDSGIKSVVHDFTYIFSIHPVSLSNFLLLTLVNGYFTYIHTLSIHTYITCVGT